MWQDLLPERWDSCDKAATLEALERLLQTAQGSKKVGAVLRAPKSCEEWPLEDAEELQQLQETF